MAPGAQLRINQQIPGALDGTRERKADALIPQAPVEPGAASPSPFGFTMRGIHEIAGFDFVRVEFAVGEFAKWRAAHAGEHRWILVAFGLASSVPFRVSRQNQLLFFIGFLHAKQFIRLSWNQVHAGCQLLSCMQHVDMNALAAPTRTRGSDGNSNCSKFRTPLA